MAELIPPDSNGVTPGTTPGERMFYRLLADVYRDRPDIVAWSNVTVSDCLRAQPSQEIDFAVLIPESGIFSVEIKDWDLGAIKVTGPSRFTVELPTGPKSVRNPYDQAHGGFKKFRNFFLNEDLLKRHDGDNIGQSILPIAWLVVFPNINRDAAAGSPFATRFDPQLTIFRDDIEALHRLPSVAEKSKRLTGLFERARKVVFTPGKIGPAEVALLKEKLFSDVCVQTAPISATPSVESARLIGTVALDERQVAIARDLPKGPRLLTGTAGSGKTLVLIHRAARLAQHDDPPKRILVTCYNFSLAKFIGDTIRRNVELDDHDRVTVLQAYDLFGDVLGEQIVDAGKGREYYESVACRAAEKAGSLPDDEKFDAIFVDEGQDFTPEMQKAVASLLRPGTDGSSEPELMVAFDPAQSLYGASDLSGFGVDFSACTTNLPVVYRCTGKIFDFAHRIAGKKPPSMLDASGGLSVYLPIEQGTEPKIASFPDTRTMVDALIRKVRELVDEKIPFAEIGILYTQNRVGGNEAVGPAPAPPPAKGGGSKGFAALAALKKPRVADAEPPFPPTIVTDFRQTGIPITWVTENSGSKRSFDLHHNSVKLSTVHTAKGLDFKAVILIEAKGLPIETLAAGKTPKTMPSASDLNLLFVGATRAREIIFMINNRPTQYDNK